MMMKSSEYSGELLALLEPVIGHQNRALGVLADEEMRSSLHMALL